MLHQSDMAAYLLVEKEIKPLESIQRALMIG
jgi:hypothetical protein